MRDRLVLGYHDVSDSAGYERTVVKAALRAQVVSLRHRGYVGTTFSRAMHAPAAGRWLAVTFDDGERGVFEHAFPALAEVGVPGTAFVSVGHVGTPGMLGWPDLAVLADAGWEIGSHTMTHRRLTELEDVELDEELRSSRKAIEDTLGQPCHSIAYPYGDVDSRVRASAAAAGFTAGCTTGGRPRDDILCWPRVGVHGSDNLLVFRLKSSRFGRMLRRTPLRAPLERVGRTARVLKSG
jgi:peptidoglycan/xylan/chitin deacetylase (PgdA/CDA1 family)